MFDFELWFNIMWDTYPLDLAHGKRGSRPVGRKAAKKKVKTQKQADRIMLSIREWIRYSRLEKQKDGYTDRWPLIATYFNQERYDCEIPSTIELKNDFIEKKEIPKCLEDGCNSDRYGPKFKYCVEHLRR